MMEKLTETELHLLDLIQQNLRCGFLDAVMPYVTFCGNMGIIWFAAALVLSVYPKYRRCSITMLVGLVNGVVIGNLLLKNIVRRDRPCWINENADMLIRIPKDYSFPSGHTMCCFAAAAVLCYYDKRLGIPAFLVAGLIAFSRMYLYVHFPTDILGGVIVGLGAAAVTVYIMEKFVYRSNRKSH